AERDDATRIVRPDRDLEAGTGRRARLQRQVARGTPALRTGLDDPDRAFAPDGRAEMRPERQGDTDRLAVAVLLRLTEQPVGNDLYRAEIDAGRAVEDDPERLAPPEHRRRDRLAPVELQDRIRPALTRLD